MKIAIIGWGSLIWQPRNLEFDSDFGWNSEGPLLPIEFSRISKDGRLTLVLDRSANTVQTLFSKSSHQDVNLAIKNLANRENTQRTNIGYYVAQENKLFPKDFFAKSQIIKWISATEFDAVIWTNLEENWSLQAGDRISYLKSLREGALENAKQYIINTPSQITTEIRKVIVEELRW